MLAGLAAASVSGRSGEDRDDVLRLGLPPVPGLDPAQARSVEQLLVADQLFDSLTQPDPRTMEPRPALAARWQSSPDQRQWDFFLRPDARFSNGRAVTGADVEFSLERVVRPGSGSAAADLLQPVTGYADFRIRRQTPDLAGISAPAPDHVRIRLDRPWAELPSVLSSPVFGVVAQESVAGPSPGTPSATPVGSGPFAFGAEQGDVITLVPAPGSRAHVDRVELVQFADVAEAYRAFTRAEVDWAGVPPEEMGAAARRYGRQAFRPYLAGVFYGFNLKSPKLSDVRFREAVVRAVDRRAVVAAVYQGTVLPTDAVVLEGVAGHRPELCPRCGYDPGRARALVEEAFPGARPPEVAIDFDVDPTQEAVARAIQTNLEEVGIKVELRPKPLGEYQNFVLSGQQEIFRLGWIAPYPSADAFLHPLFST
ncbi:MAG TPA: ABC transporter substrate-binding protein, partial [Acidimicrobiales bacterium]|nr:ABC transporter substrate-binding protein [Acidimicrobiales bacterium]